MSKNISLTRTSDIDAVWSTLVEIYAKVWGERLHEPHYSVERYGERLARHASEPGWEALIGYDGAEAIGYAYGNTIQHDDRWWSRTTPAPLPAHVRVLTFAFKEGMLRARWRALGLAQRGHDELLTARRETQSVLLVNPRSGGGKVKALYESWGYQEIGTQQPTADGPVLSAMIRSILA
ncbi:GNAT family N-acetyltransferase [Streptomyces sp. TRM 70351]|uniref:GNAT family N-acetyltransferase n=1 Tax=Streptomyces sp. TRM 70351 TaxID=3116552 RepID=UPI002E7BB520|nr:GNAT family N-acetyltransferase [Streptomyces sp. TRM 70351]MEE1929579.1 GNAT family N-acetyltransferase [Streptomyces sp. TRM 70351]